MKRVVITGIGAVCAGASNKEQLEKLCSEGILGIKEVSCFSTEGLSTNQFGEADISATDRTPELIRLSGAQMLEDAGINQEYIQAMGRKCRMFYGTLMLDAPFYLKHSDAKAQGKEENCLSDMNSYIRYAAEFFGVRGAVDVCSAACASGTTAAGMAYEFIASGMCETAIFGGADALNEMSAYGFNALRSLSNGCCNPYDEDRDGINIGECGAFFFAEELEHALARGAHIYGEIVGFATGNDAYHITSPEPEGKEAVHTMSCALENAGITADKIDYINGHGTGTAINDRMEKMAVDAVYGDSEKKPYVSSTKALVGHCMGASGAIELASILMSMQTGRPIKMPRLQKPIDQSGIFTAPETIQIDYAMSNSFAFAGSSASLIIKAWGGIEK